MVTKFPQNIINKFSKFTFYANSTNKIWLFVKPKIQCSLLVNHHQFLHIQFAIGAQVEFASFIYASCLPRYQQELWHELMNLGKNIDSFWILGGDFNCITSPTEKRGGKTSLLSPIAKFNNFISDASLFDLGFKGPKFTWRRGTLWERLDRLLDNSLWFQTFPFCTVTHLAMAGYDHRLILFSIQNTARPTNTPFRFQNMWTLHLDFIKEVGNNWNSNLNADR
ncbi:uncharacterized protein LOC110035685 [Phalaenopsis equestris]|uniref:uncharacterized protein LOC110035685 n=1 Tax=Phalaenopsis equestris TaxID=78828 RepID=UPI0009E35F8D|nr:uncharacterized protein LOC110035685 [Phalaenopsis equestris]